MGLNYTGISFIYQLVIWVFRKNPQRILIYLDISRHIKIYLDVSRYLRYEWMWYIFKITDDTPDAFRNIILFTSLGTKDSGSPRQDFFHLEAGINRDSHAKHLRKLRTESLDNSLRLCFLECLFTAKLISIHWAKTYPPIDNYWVST
jgi:hypothetical protein